MGLSEHRESMSGIRIDLDSITSPAWIADPSDRVVWTNTVLTDRDDLATDISVLTQQGDALRLFLGRSLREAEEADLRSLVAQETEHRARNVVSLAMAIANQSLGSIMHEPAVQRFLDRMQSLSEVTRVSCEFTGDRCEIGAIARTIARRFDDADRSRIHCSGPEAWIPSRWGHMMAIVLHELGANAIRHGSLRPGPGVVHLGWRMEDSDGGRRRLRLEWIESGGAPIKDVRSEGFGSRILKGIANAGSRCNAEFDLHEEGLRYVMTVVLDEDEVAA